MPDAPTQIYAFDRFRLDAPKRLLFLGDLQVPLSSRVFDTLLYLVKNSGRVVGKDELLREIWTDSIVEENNLDKNISVLRKVLGEKPGEQRFIVTVRGHGYRFAPEVSEYRGPEPQIADTNSKSTATDATATRVEDPDIEEVRGNPPPVERVRNEKAKWIAVSIVSLVVVFALGYYVWNVSRPSGDNTIRTLAVLPFKPVVVQNRNEALEYGMADSLISKLSGGALVVRPLSAIRQFASPEQDSLAAGRELGVDSVLDGTIQNWGERVRVSAKLIRTSDGAQLWAGQFNEKFTDIFDVQDSISEKVSSALKLQLGTPAKKHSTENVEAYQAYMKGRYHLSKLDPADFGTAEGFFREAIELDPNYALPYVELSNAYRVKAISGEAPAGEVADKAKAADKKAVELDDTLAQAHVALGSDSFWFEWDWAAAEKHYQRARELDPALAIMPYAHLLSNLGRHDEALAEAKRSRELDPIDLVTNALEGQFLLHAGRTDEALERLQKTMELEPAFWMPHFFASSAYIEKGMFDRAIEESNREKELTGGNVIPFGAYALARSGRREEAVAELNRLLRLSAERYVPPYNIALIYNALEDREKALDWLEKAYEQRDPKMTFLKVEPKWNDLRSQPRFVDLMKKMNF